MSDKDWRDLTSWGKKGDTGKARWDLIPWSPGMYEVVNAYTEGARKYGEYNWAQGIAYDRLFAALMRHLMAYWIDREWYDPENGQHHLASVIFYCLAFMHFDRNGPDCDNRKGGARGETDGHVAGYERETEDGVSREAEDRVPGKSVSV